MTYKEQLKTEEWKQKRIQILKRDNFQCQCCGISAKEELLHVHHLYYERNKMAWEYDNEVYVTLCKEHHKYIHGLDKIIALIAFKVIKYDINLVLLDDLIYLAGKDKIDHTKFIQEHFEHKVNCYRSYGFDKEYFKYCVKMLKQNLELKHNVVLKKVDTNIYRI